VTSLFASLEADGTPLVLAYVTNSDGEFGLASHQILEPGDHLIEFVAIIVIDDATPTLWPSGPLGLG